MELEPERVEFFIQSSNFNYHPLFNRDTRNFDIAAIQTDSPIIFNLIIKPVLLPPPGSTDQFVSSIGISLGWGTGSDFLLHLYKNLIVGSLNCLGQFPPGIITANDVCLTGTLDRGPCVGDEGGPLIRFDSELDEYVLIGISSLPSCGSGVPHVFTRVTNMRQWILSVTGV